MPETQKDSPQNHLSDVELSPSENVGMSEDEEEEELEEEKGVSSVFFLPYSRILTQ